MADDKDKNAAIRNLDRIRTLLGSVPAIQEEGQYKRDTNTINLGKYSPDELKRMTGSKEINLKNQQGGLTGVVNHLEGIAENSKNIIGNSKLLHSITPELKQATQILVSSIMSPNDLQEGEVHIAVECDELDKVSVEKISKMLNEYFNDTLGFGDSLSNWLADILILTGSKPVAILPKSNLRILDTVTKGVDRATSVEVITEEFKKCVNGPSVSLENIDLSINSNNDKLAKELNVAIESIFEEQQNTTVSKKHIKKITNDIVNNTTKFFKDRSTKDYIIVSDNTSVVGAQNNIKDKKDDLFKKYLDTFFTDDGVDGVSAFFTNNSTEDMEKNDHPIMIEFSSESVIPICVPGSVSSHIGYFVLVDEWGNPISNTSEAKAGDPLTKETTNAFFGVTHQGDFGSRSKQDVALKVFNVALKQMIDQKLDNMGLVGLDVGDYNAVSNCMFNNLLKKKKTRLVFIPENLMIYYRFDHRENGTGKSRVEDVNFIVSLRTTLMIAQIMSATREAIDSKTVNVTLDENTQNVEQVLDMMKNIYAEKHAMKFDTVDPSSISKRITEAGLTIAPKGIMGTKDLTVDVDTNSKSSSRPDTDLMDQLSNMLVTYLGVPHSALNQLGENEYAKSVATSNLFFSNEIRRIHKMLAKFNNKFVRNYLMFSSVMRNKIIEIISGEVVDKENKKNKVSDKELVDNIKGSKSGLLKKVISGITVELPSPNMSTNKAQYEEMREYLSFIDEVMDRMFNEDIVPVDNSEYRDTVKALRAQVIKGVVRKFINNVGFQGSLDIPELDDIDDMELNKTLQRIMNLSKGTKDISEKLVPGDDNSSSGSSW